MQSSLSGRLVKNTTANVIRGGATALVAIALPKFLTQHLDTEHFAVWSLMLQISAYASYLDFGLQTAIGRFVAQTLEFGQRERQAGIVGTAFFLLSVAAITALTVIFVVLWQSPHIFSAISGHLLTEFRHASLILSLCTCILLPLSTYTGVLIGMGRNELPALTIGVSRVGGALAVIIASHYTQSLLVLAICFGVPNLAGGLTQMFMVLRLERIRRVTIFLLDREIGKELIRFCAGLTVWSLAMLVISGLDLTIVGHYQLNAVGYYSLAAILASFLTGLTNSALSAAVAPFAVLHIRDDREGMLRLLAKTTHLTVTINALFCAMIFIAGGKVLHIWVGPAYASEVLPLLKVLAVAQTIRLIGGPFSVVLIASGEQNKSLSAVLLEATTNITASILGAIYIGPLGVALGTLLGSMFSIVWTIYFVMPRMRTLKIHVANFLYNAVLPGFAPALPIFLLYLLRPHTTSNTFEVSVIAATLTSGTLIWSTLKKQFTIST